MTNCGIRSARPAKLQRQLDAAKSHGVDSWSFSATFLGETFTSDGRQLHRDSDLDPLQLGLLGTADVERAMEWLSPYRAAMGGAAT